MELCNSRGVYARYGLPHVNPKANIEFLDKYTNELKAELPMSEMRYETMDSKYEKVKQILESL